MISILGDGPTTIHDRAGLLFQVELAHKMFHRALVCLGALSESNQEIIDMCVRDCLKSRGSMQIVEALLLLGLHKPCTLKHFLAVLVPRTSSTHIQRLSSRRSNQLQQTLALVSSQEADFCLASATAIISRCHLTGDTLTGNQTRCSPVVLSCC